MADTARLTAREAAGDLRAHGARVGRSAAGIAARSGHRNDGFAPGPVVVARSGQNRPA